jgi:hypothetical protein
MRTITVSKRAKNLVTLLKQAQQENLILQSPDGKEYVLAEIDDFDREVELTRQNEEFMAFLDHRARQTKTIPLEASIRDITKEKESKRNYRIRFI